MKKSRKPRGYWTKEKCQIESLKYKTRTEFCKKSSRAYQLYLKNGWIDSYQKSKLYTFEHCKIESKKYTTIKELIINDHYLYRKILDNKWDKKLYKHMNVFGNLHNRCIYVYEFSDNHAYIGLTYNLNKRDNRYI